MRVERSKRSAAEQRVEPVSESPVVSQKDNGNGNNTENNTGKNADEGEKFKRILEVTCKAYGEALKKLADGEK